MTIDVGNPLRDAALAYAARGWAVLPLHRPMIGASRVRCSCSAGAECRSCGKHPDTPHGWKDATTDPEKIRAWWTRTPTANVGIATGVVSNLVVLDIDTRHGGEATLAALETRHGALPPTVEAITGSGGSHKFFRHPGVGVVIPISASKVGEGLDIRADGGLVAGAPSLHHTGRRYTWDVLGDPDEAELADLPPWLLALVVKPQQPARPTMAPTASERARRWLGTALADARPGNRNEKGHWLACQLRDNGVSRGAAESLMREYAARVPQGDADRYTEREALATLAGVLNSPAREPAKGTTYVAPWQRPPPPVKERPADEDAGRVVADPNPSAGDELRDYLGDVVDGRVFNVPWPWTTLTEMTQALLPGSNCVIGGDPGVGKTFFVLQCLRFWHANGIKPAVFFLEKNRRFHTMRLLAQLEGDGNFVNHAWLKDNPRRVAEGIARHKEYIDEIGGCIWSKPSGALTVDFMLKWVEDRAREGRRVIVIDPITAVDAGADRWTKDDHFVRTANDIITAHGCSLVSVTHPKQGTAGKGGTTSGHSAAGGAAYFRFTDTMCWLTRSKKPRKVKTQTPFGMNIGPAQTFVLLFKTRDGKGAGAEVAFSFGQKLGFDELGVVTEDLRDAMTMDDDPPHAPHVTPIQDPFADPEDVP